MRLGGLRRWCVHHDGRSGAQLHCQSVIARARIKDLIVCAEPAQRHLLERLRQGDGLQARLRDRQARQGRGHFALALHPLVEWWLSSKPPRTLEP